MPPRAKPKALRVVPDERVFVRTSERNQFLQCRQAHQWAYTERLKPKGMKMNALLFGDMIHRALAAYYIPERAKARKRGPHPAVTFTHIYTELVKTGWEVREIQDDEEKLTNAWELGVDMMENYIDTYGKDERILVIYPEMPFQYDLFDGDGRYVCTYVGTTDALIYDLETHKYGLFEHKTAASITTDHLFLDEQASTYWTLVPLWLHENGILKDMDDLDFMLYNFMRKSKRNTKPKDAQGRVLNQDGSVSKRQPPPLLVRQPLQRGYTDRQHTYDRILAHVHEMNLVRTGELEVYKNPQSGIMSNCKFCDFRDMCEMHEIGADWESLKEQMFQVWDPYRDHVWSLDLAGAGA